MHPANGQSGILHELMHAVKQGYRSHTGLRDRHARGDGCTAEHDNASGIWTGIIRSDGGRCGGAGLLPCEITADSIQIKGRKRKYYSVQDRLYPHVVIQ